MTIEHRPGRGARLGSDPASFSRPSASAGEARGSDGIAEKTSLVHRDRARGRRHLDVLDSEAPVAALARPQHRPVGAPAARGLLTPAIRRCAMADIEYRSSELQGYPWVGGESCRRGPRRPRSRSATPSTLSALEDSAAPPAPYRLVTEEDRNPGLSFTAFRRTAALLLCLPANPVPGGTRQVVRRYHQTSWPRPWRRTLREQAPCAASCSLA